MHHPPRRRCPLQSEVSARWTARYDEATTLTCSGTIVNTTGPRGLRGDGLPPNGKFGKAVDQVRVDTGHRVRIAVDLEAVETGDDLLEHHARLDARQGRPQAEVRSAGTERDVLVRRARDVELIGFLECALITVRRHVRHHDAVTRGNRHTADL